MRFLPGYEIKNFIEGIIYLEKQMHKESFDLTVNTVYELKGEGSFDFGGSEYCPAVRIPLEPKKRKNADKYGWWELSEGIFIIKYNEILTLNTGQKAIIQMHPHLLESGVFHPTRIIENIGELLMPLSVVKKINIKENARISELMIWEA